MRMRFDADDEAAFYERRDDLTDRFARWLETHRVAGEPSDAELLMDWKFGYGDGALATWTTADVEEFLFAWCPRKLSAPAPYCAKVPGSVAAFVEFLAHAGLLAPGSGRPSDIRRYCERHTDRFLREMRNPANFGMAKSMFAGAPLPEGEDALEGIAAMLEQLHETSPDAVREFLEAADAEEEPRTVGPVRMPDSDERLAAIKAADDLRLLRALAEHCPPPGRQLTEKGNIRLAEARSLVEALGTGENTELGGYRRLQSAEDLPVLSRLVNLGLAAGVVRRNRGRLVAVATFAKLDDAAAHEKVVRAAFEIGLSAPSGYQMDGQAPVQRLVDSSVIILLAELLDAGSVGVEVDDLFDLMRHLVTGAFSGLAPITQHLVPIWLDAQLDRLEQLGVLTLADAEEECPDCEERHQIARLTAAGIPVAVELVREAGIPVAVRVDPAGADVADIADLIGEIPPSEWEADAEVWFAARPDRAEAADALVTEITAEHREPATVLLGLQAVADVVGEHAVPAVRRQMGGPHDGLVLHWLSDNAEFDPESVEPARLLGGLVDVLAATLDLGEPEDVLDILQDEEDMLPELMETLWRMDHPRVGKVLEVIGAHHPAKAMSKAARKALMKHRNR
jgi:hypothetical protein